MSGAIPTTRLVAGLPSTVPFVGPEALERRNGYRFHVRLGANESNFGPSPRAVEAMREAVGRVSNYADPECYDLRAAVAAFHGLRLENVVVASGIDELLGLIIRAYLEHGETLVASLGAYPTVSFHVAGFGGTMVRVPYTADDRNDLDALAEAAHANNARLVYLANPDNPSGSWRSAADVQAFAARLPESCLFLLDEAYAEFAPADALPPMGEPDPRIIRLRTFSKAYGMAGARVGYALATPETILQFDKIRLHFGVNLVAQAGALAALADGDYMAGVVRAVEEGRRDYTALAQELGLVALPSATNFVTIDVGGADRARALVTEFAERGVFIRMPGAAPLDRCIRVTVGTPPERARFAEIFREAWAAVAARS